MRTRMHIILWILLILFIGSMTVGGLVGGADIVNQLFGRVDISKAIVVVNGEAIPPDLFFHQLNHRMEQARTQGVEVDDRSLDFERERIYNELIEATIINQQIADRKINVTAEEIYYELINNPPQTLKTIPDFQTNGVFDQVKYLEALRNPQGDEWRPIEDYVRQYLPRQKLFNELRAGVHVSEEEVRTEFTLQNVEYTISALIVRGTKFTNTEFEPTDDEMENYYFINPEEFEQNEQRVLSYVEWVKSPSQEDTLLAQETASDILARLDGGADFAELANEYSEDPGNRAPDGSGRGGDLGWFGRGQMVAQFEEAAFTATKGDVVGPVQTDFGLHVIEVRDSRKDNNGEEQVQASHILLKINMGPSTRERIRSDAVQFSFDVEDFDFDEAVVRNNSELKTSRPFTENAAFIPPFGYFPEPIKFAFVSNLGTSSEIVESDQVFAIFRLDSVITAGTKEYSTVRNQIANKLRMEKRMAGAKSKAEEMRSSLKEDKSFEELANSDDIVEFVGPVSSKLGSSFQKIGRHESVIGALLSAEVGVILPPVETSQAYVILKLEDRQDFDEEDWEVKKDLIRKTLLTQRENEAIGNWVKTLKENADIVDNRKYYF
ncbi:MAG: peptidylprolyl isomerase [Candidatus Neomarinimicrobiota bacterium]|nr:peptidylprolyl isomerase [Candidatus Neomarinimicrobiota bacterium]